MIQSVEFKTIFELLQAFPDEQACISYLEKLRWEGLVISPFDEASKVYKCKGNKYKCRNKAKYFNVRTGTIFEDTKVPLQKWFMALFIISSNKKGISSHQLAKDIGITQKSAWFLLNRLRYGFDHPSFKEVWGNSLEVDEKYISVPRRNKRTDKKIDVHKVEVQEIKQPGMTIIGRTI